MDSELENLINVKVKPLLDEAMQKNLGITVSELESDISNKLKTGVFEFNIDTSMKFKHAKRKFRQDYVSRLLNLHLGNVADVARVANMDRRSIHRIVAEMKLDVERLRNALERGAYVKELAVRDIIQNCLENYKPSLNPLKYEALYKQAPVLSKNIVKELPESPKTLKQAEKEFEIKYLKKALEENNWNVSKTARKIGLRFETLFRKLKILGIKSQ